MSKTVPARGLTLIEVLLAVVLLASLAAVSVGIIRDAGLTSSMPDETVTLREASRLADDIISAHTNELYGLQIGQLWRPPVELYADHKDISFERRPCDDCPEGFGRFLVMVDETSRVRFHKIKPIAEGSP